MGTGRLYRVPEGCANRSMPREEAEHRDSCLEFKRVKRFLRGALRVREMNSEGGTRMPLRQGVCLNILDCSLASLAEA